MAIISNLNDYNIQPYEQIIEPQEQRQETNIRYIPSLMKEQRENVKLIFDIFDFAEKKGIITINRPEPIVVEETKVSGKEIAIAAVVIFAIIRIGLMIV